ncbi:MAG: hypothetical protein D6813_03905, partial [Calditrichaeota bacterium]
KLLVLFWGFYLFFILICFLIFDLLIGVLLIKNNTFLGYPLPPYGPLITETQKQRFEKMGHDSSSYIVFDKFLGWTIGPNRKSNNGLYKSNSYGMRSDREYNRLVSDGIFRIAVFGDSFTEGVDVSNENTWPSILEQKLKKVEVLNFGVRAYGTDQALLRYKRDGQLFHPYLVIIGYMIENIRRNVNVYRPIYEHNTGGIGIKPRFIIEGDSLKLIPIPVKSPEELKSFIKNGTIFEKIEPYDYWYQKYKIAFQPNNWMFKLNSIKIAWLIYEKHARNLKRLYAEVNKEPFLVTVRILETFYNTVKQNGSRALVLILPAKGHLEEFMENHTKFWQPLLNYLEKRRIEYLDVTEALALEQLKSPVVYGHYTDKGNEVVAEVVKNWLLKNIITEKGTWTN